jgi:tetratricopeptide (TPR) repeat protein
MQIDRRITLALRQLTVLCAGAALLACSAPPLSQSALPASAQLEADADGYYALGRNHYVARRYDAARQAYQRALALVPTHIDASNGLATLYAARGELAPAIAIWRALTAQRQQEAGKDDAFLFNNLGYAYLLAGAAAEAQAALERACLLDPRDYRAWENLADALHQQGEHERAQQLAMQAASLRRHDLQADYAALAEVRPEAAFAGANVHIGAALARPERLALPPAPAPDKDAAVALEISNGNGVKGMAAAVGRSVNRHALRVVRLSNQRGFGVARTRIEFEQGHAAAARTLAARFHQAALVPVAKVDGAGIRLVIGHDLVHDASRARLAGR